LKNIYHNCNFDESSSEKELGTHQTVVHIRKKHLDTAIKISKASLSAEERARYDDIYREFRGEEPASRRTSFGRKTTMF
jgi:hypothetical protein